MSQDAYKDRLKNAGWGWMEEHSWNQGKFPKDRRMGRREKRGARNEEKAERHRQQERTRP